jgi:flagellar basal body-associated protein FliL
MIQAEEPSELPLPVSGGKWALNKLILIAAPTVIVVLVITGVLCFYLARTDNTVTKLQSGTRAGTPTDTLAVTPAAMIEKKKPQSAETISTQTAIVPVKVNNANFKDFIIDLKDKTGKSKILMCDVALEVTGEGVAELENRTDIRNLIYQTVTGKNAVVLRSLEERKRLRNELLQEANKILGERIVKNVYFTNYVIM